MQTDPIGALDDLNLYTYVGGDPLNAADPMGLEKEEDDEQDNQEETSTACKMSVRCEVSYPNGKPGTPTQEDDDDGSNSSYSDTYTEPTFEDAFNEKAAELLAPIAEAADSAVDYWASEGGVTGAVFGTLAATVDSNNIGRTVATSGTAYLGSALLRPIGSAANSLGRALGPSGPIFGRTARGGSSLFGINSNGLLRIGWGWKGTSTNGTNVFRVSGKWVKKVGVKSGHIDLFAWP